MSRTFLPYYLSRLSLSLLVAWLAFGWGWGGALLAAVLFALFLLYLHAGWFIVNPASPLFPLRLDGRAREVQRQALIIAVVLGVTVLAGMPLLDGLAPAGLAPSSAAVVVSIASYFVVQWLLLSSN